MVEFSENMQVVELELFDAAESVALGREEEARRRFMTLFVHEEHGRRGGSADVLLATNAQGERFALKRLRGKAAAGKPAGAARKELRHSLSGDARSATPDYVTRGHAAAFYEEYRIHLAVSKLRGFPALHGFGLAGGEPLILMEWVEGETLRDALRHRHAQDESPLPLQTVARLGVSVLQLLERASSLQTGFVHRDLSPRNIMLRTDRTPASTQLESDEFDLCLVDFGSASTPPETPADPTFTMQEGVWRMGTPAYAPPEMLSSDVALPATMRQSPAIDVYALASILYELYAGRKPFDVQPGGMSPYRLKTETAPAPLAPRSPDGGALAGIILAGLSPLQDDRPSIAQMRAALENWQSLPGQRNIGTIRGPKPADASLWQPGFASRVITRRKFVAFGLVAAAAIASAGIVGSALARRQAPAIDESRYERAGAVYSGEPLFKAFDGERNGWLFATAAGDIACKPTSSREPGALRQGLIALYDDISQRCGYITPTGAGDGYAWAILPAFAAAGDFHEGLAAAQDPESKRWGYIGTDGAWRIPARYRNALPLSQGAASVQADNGAWGAIAPNGEWLVEPRFAMLGSRDAGVFCIAQDPQADAGLAWGIVNSHGEWTGTARFTRLRRMVDGVAPALDADTALWGFADAQGAWAIPPRFRDARPFSEGLAAVQDGNTQLWFFINPDGTPAHGMEPRFWKLGELHDGLAPAQASLDDDMVVFDNAQDGSYVEGVAKRYGYVDASGSWQMRRLTSLTDTAIGPANL